MKRISSIFARGSEFLKKTLTELRVQQPFLKEDLKVSDTVNDGVMHLFSLNFPFAQIVLVNDHLKQPSDTSHSVYSSSRPQRELSKAEANK